MKKGKIVVFGSFVVDLTSWAKHLPVPGETVKGSVFKMGPGGKGSNQGVAASRAGADVTLVTKVGNDVFGKIALDFYQNEHMTTDFVFLDAEKETGTALIMVDETVVLRRDHGAFEVTADLWVGHPLLAPAQGAITRDLGPGFGALEGG